ncbi:hypothetical protein ABFV57_05360 [Pseudomonas neuropathica]|uniref:hypothetical protein n=1 Tax=Pseudomonas neuropathica TaxID=2730425 RepID=UPI0034D3E370
MSDSRTSYAEDELPPAITRDRESVAGTMAEAWHAAFALELGKEELTFIAGIHAYLRSSIDAGLDENALRAIFLPLNELMHGDRETEALRCTKMITRLKMQGVLLRADFGGVSVAGEFTLSPLGLALGEYMESERTLTKQSLEFMLIRLRTELASMVESARAGGDSAHWESTIAMPLKLIVTEMINLIDKRQRGMDAAHTALRTDIGALFESSWIAAIDCCTLMLKNVAATLGELNAVLAEHTEALGRQLLEIADAPDCPHEINLIIDRARNQILRIHIWSESRHDAWSQYFATVNEYIRLVIQVDPDNRMRSRLRQQLKQYPTRPYGLRYVNPEPFLHLRTVSRPTAEVPVVISADVIDRQALEVRSHYPLDQIDLVIAQLVSRFKNTGEIDIVAATLEEAAAFTDHDWFILLARATPLLLQHGLPEHLWLEQVWISMSDRLDAQTLVLRLLASVNKVAPDDV